MSRLDVLQWSEIDRKSIFGVYGKTVDDVQQEIETIKEWMSKQPHFPEIAENRVIERYLLTNKFRTEIVKEKLERYYNVRNLIPEFYKYPTDEAIKKIMEIVDYVPLPKLTKDLHRVLIIKVKSENIEKYDVLAYVAHTLNISEVRIRDDILLKEIQIYDLDCFRVAHFAKFTPTILKKCIFVIENVFSNLIHEIHFVNAPSYADKFLTFFNATLNPKLNKRIFVHKNVDSLKEMVSTEILPKDYGGNEKSLQELTDDWNKVLLKYEDVFQHLMKTKVDQSLLPEHRRFGDEIFGVYGNFKQLNLD